MEDREIKEMKLFRRRAERYRRPIRKASLVDEDDINLFAVRSAASVPEDNVVCDPTETAMDHYEPRWLPFVSSVIRKHTVIG